MLIFCVYRYDNVLVPREEGRILYDVNPRKPKKNKATVYKVCDIDPCERCRSSTSTTMRQ